MDLPGTPAPPALQPPALLNLLCRGQGQGLHTGHQAEPLWGKAGEGCGITGLPFSLTPTAASLVQHGPTETGKAGPKLALNASPAPPFCFLCAFHIPFTPSHPPFRFVKSCYSGAGWDGASRRRRDADRGTNDSCIQFWACLAESVHTQVFLVFFSFLFFFSWH